MQGQKILITGGEGFIGNHLANALEEENEVTIMDKKDGQDVLNMYDCMNAAKDKDIIFHLAAMAGVKNVKENPAKTLELNLMGTRNMLGAAINSNVKKFILTSTSEVYGSFCFSANEEGNTSQGSLSNPRWFYAVSKLAAEAYVKAYYEEHGLETLCLRYFNIYGANQNGQGGIANFCRAAISNKPLKVIGDGSSIRSWCYIDDCIAGTIKMTERAGHGKSINIGNSTEPINARSLAERVIRLSGSKSKVFFMDEIEEVQLRVPDTSLAKEYGFKAQISLDEGLKKTIKWYGEKKCKANQ